MSGKFSRWLRSRAGMGTLIAVLALLVVAAIVGQLVGWWAALADLITGTVAPPAPHYDPPEGGFTCLPAAPCGDDAPQDGRFLRISNDGMRTFAGTTIVAWISVPGDMRMFQLGIFDGDTGKDNSGNLAWKAGNWDDSTTEATYTLYADPLKNNNGGAGGGFQVGRWLGNSANSSTSACTVSAPTMPNNAWYTITCNQASQAQGPNGHYFYRLEITQPVESYGGNAFKLRSTGYLATGRFDLINASFAIYGPILTMQDVYALYPQFQGSLANLGPSNYTGDWAFKLYVPNEQVTMEFWDGDFDRGTSPTSDPDTDDFNTTGKPPWAGPFTMDEGIGGGNGVGAPADNSRAALYRRGVPVQYEIVDPNGTPIYVNTEPSGTEEWEAFIVSTDPAVQADLTTDSIAEGFYTWHITGLDAHNLVFIRTNLCIADQPFGCSDPWYEGGCPRTIGYWKNNVNKIYIQNKTRGVQESRQTLDWALRNVALASPLFRSGINICAPAPIADPAPLTPQEADRILQRASNNYPGCDRNSMLARALQQNLAAWLNLGSGKVGPTTVIELPCGYRGTLWGALQEAQDIILNRRNDAAALEYAKNIGDQINNGLLGENAETSTCQDYVQIIPSGKQPPAFDDMPEAPTPVPPPNPTPVPTPNPNTCAGLRTNRYNVEATNNPFPGIKFNYQSGTEVRGGDYDEFKITLTAAQAAALTSVQMEAKAGQNVGQATIENCQFNQGLVCGPVMDANGYFAFTFMGAVDNGNGTMTLTFQVQNMTNRGLSHATVGLPEGTPNSGVYESKVCPSQ